MLYAICYSASIPAAWALLPSSEDPCNSLVLNNNNDCKIPGL